MYKPWKESSCPVSAVAQEFGVCPRAVVNLYWAQCQVRERYRQLDLENLIKLEDVLKQKVRAKNKVNAWQVPYRQIIDALLEIGSTYRPIKL